jgi:hypothetical protein
LCRALVELQTKGFIDITQYGGILHGKGMAAIYHLSSKWESWQPPERKANDMKQARAARKKNRKEGE